MNSNMNFIRNKKNGQINILIIGNDTFVFDLYKSIDNFNEKNQIYIYTNNKEIKKKVNNNIISGNFLDISNVFLKFKINEVFISNSKLSKNDLMNIIEESDKYGIRIRIVPEIFHISKHSFEMSKIGDIPVLNLQKTSLDEYYNCLNKKIFDYLFAFIILVLLSPFMILLSLMIKLFSKGPIFYMPERVGKDGNVFKLIKFRSMHFTSIPSDNLSTKKDDIRITKIGKFMRKYNLDELPQFYNVLRGDMSIVGPRPHRVFLDRKLQNEIDNYMMRHYIKPGITGLAAVNGWRGPMQTNEQRLQRNKYDLMYLSEWSFFLDIKIIFLTVFGRKVRKNCF